MIEKNAKNHSAEDQLLAALMKGASGSALESAVQEGVFYPLYRHVFSDDEKEKCRQMYYLHIAEGAAFLRKVERVLDHIESRKIRVLIFKGPTIDYFLYDQFVRPRIDLDIIPGEEEVSRLEDALQELGFTAPPCDKDYPLPEYLNSRLFINKSEELVPVHIHKHLINNMFLTTDSALSMDMRKVWSETERFKNYRSVYMLKPELNILYLCEHGLKHGFDQLIYLYEIKGMLRHYNGRFDWKKFVALAKIFGLERAAYYGLYFMKEMLSGDVPEEVMEQLKPARYSAGEKKFMRDTLHKKRSRYSSYPVYLAMRKSLPAKAHFIFRTLFPPGFSLKGCLVRVRRLILP